MCVNSMIASGWDVANNKYEEPAVYNFVPSTENPISWGTYNDLAIYHGQHIPFSRSVWYYRFTMTSNAFLVLLMKIFYHLLPAFIMDIGLVLVGKKPKYIHLPINSYHIFNV